MNAFLNNDINIEKIIIACYVPPGNGQITHTDRKSHGLAIRLNGECIYNFSSGQHFCISANDIILLPKFSTYTAIGSNPGGCYAINFDIYDDMPFEPAVLKVKNRSKIIEHFANAQKIWQRKDIGYTSKCKAELYNILCLMQQELFSDYFPNTKLEIIKPAVDYIHKNYTKEIISIENLSEMCGITPEYFRKIFKSFFSLSPVNYINNLKISRAKELLRTNEYSVTDVALLSGYTDTSIFSRSFKKATGISPSKYI